jgi:hypothetical protein
MNLTGYMKNLLLIKATLVLFLTALLLGSTSVYSTNDEKNKARSDYHTEHVFLITLDGLRWQELYSGADSMLIGHEDYIRNPEQLKKEFWDDDPLVRRVNLLPFFWNVISEKGQLYGNRKLGNYVDLTNEYRFSYPGYSELLTGNANPDVDSNAKRWNPNKTVLEFIHDQPGFEGKVAAFASWDVFPYIINSRPNNIPVNAGFDPVSWPDLTDREELLNEMLSQIPQPWSTVRNNAFTYHYAMEYVKKYQPRLLYLAFDETDEFAHSGDYQNYLYSARQVDAFISALWNFVQNDPFYQGKTTFIIATDHGRGTDPIDHWRHHGANIEGAEEVWFAFIGPDTPATGEMDQAGQLYQDQIAATLAAFLDLNFEGDTTAGEVIRDVFKE